MKYKTYDFSDISQIKLLGRTVCKDNSLLLPWSYSGFSFNYIGRSFFLSFDKYEGASPAYIRVSIDGGTFKYPVCSGNDVIITSDAKDGLHHAVITRVTEDIAPISLKSITIKGNEPHLAFRPLDRKKKLLFIGDSITCGYGIEAASSVSVFNTFEEDCTMSYAYFTAKRLDAEILFAGASGKGIVANCLGDRNDMTLRQAFRWETRQGGEWDHSKFIPSAVIINAGTNDAWGGVSDEEFSSAATDFIKEIREIYKEAKIIWIYGIMDTSKLPCIENTINTVRETDPNVFFIPIESISLHSNEIGAAGHPNINTSYRVAYLLTYEIRKIVFTKPLTCDENPSDSDV